MSNNGDKITKLKSVIEMCDQLLNNLQEHRQGNYGLIQETERVKNQA